MEKGKRKSNRKIVGYIKHPDFGLIDHYYNDGSKSYETFNYGRILITDKKMVKLLDHALRIEDNSMLYEKLQRLQDDSGEIKNIQIVSDILNIID